MRRLAFVSLVLAAACNSQNLGDAPLRDAEPPKITIESPMRGAILESGAKEVEVKGRVEDDERGDGVKTVLVNGQAVTLTVDGRFTVRLPVGEGITMIHTEAADIAGNMESDSRAVLAGNLVRGDTAVPQAVTADLTPEAIGIMGQVAAKTINMVDFEALVKGMNPVFNAGITCLKARVDVTRLQRGAVTVQLSAADGGLRLVADVRSLDASLDVQYDAACTVGRANVGATADNFHLEGLIAMKVAPGGGLEIEIKDPQAYLSNFRLTGDIPQNLKDWISTPLGLAMGQVITLLMKDFIPKEIAKFIGGSEQLIDLMGRSLSVRVKPTAAHFDRFGARFVLDSNIFIPSVAGGLVYVQSNTARPTWTGAAVRDMRLGVADDAINQVVTSFWGAGYLDQAIDTAGGSYAGVGTLFDRVEVHFRLPPVVTALSGGRGLKVAVGDIEASFIKKENGVDKTITRVSVSAEAAFTLSVGGGGVFKLTSTDPMVWIDILSDGVDGSNPFNKSTFKELGSFAAKQMIGVIAKLIEKTPIPAFQGAAIINGTVTTGEGAGGYLMVSGDLRMQ